MNQHTRRGILAGALTMALTTGSQTAQGDTTLEASLPSGQIHGEFDRTYRLVSGVLRSASGTWGWINDTNHRPTGVRTVTQTSGYIVLPYNFAGKRVSSLQVTPDETFASIALRVGASVGLSETRIYLYTTDPYAGRASVAANPSTIKSSTGNLWVTGYIEV